MVLHVTSWLSRKGGGIPPVIMALARETNRNGLKTAVVGLKDEWSDVDCQSDGFAIATGAIVGPQALSYSPELDRQLQAHWMPRSVVHSHGLWMYSGLAARRCANRNNSPLMISPHGMLEPWALNNARWKKKLAALLFENQNLAQARCLHALCQAEARNFRSYGLKNPIAVIPNGIDLEKPENGRPNDLVGRFPALKGRQHALFLSRLHPKKGLNNLFEAWRQVGALFSNWQLLIAGSGDLAYENELKTLAGDLISRGSVVFLGPLYGDEKQSALALADVFVLPSFSEGFSIAILEAAAASLPVLLTPECNFPELAQYGAALEVAANPSAIEAGLRQLLELKDEQRKAMGRRGRELVEKSYTWGAVALQMRSVYEWLTGSGPMPGTVQCV